MEEPLVEQIPQGGRKSLNKNSVLYKKAVTIIKLRRVSVILLVTAVFFLVSKLIFGGDLIDLGWSAETCEDVVFWLYISAVIIAAIASAVVSFIKVDSCTTAQLENKTLFMLINTLWGITLILPSLLMMLRIGNYTSGDSHSTFSIGTIFGKSYIMEFVVFFIVMFIPGAALSSIRTLQNKFVVGDNGQYSGAYKDLLGEIADCKTVRDQNELIFHANPKFANTNASYPVMWAYANRVNISSVAATIVAFAVAMAIILVPIFGSPVSLAKAEKIEIGMSISAVEDILGKADDGERGMYMWADNNYKQLYNRHVAIEKEIEKLMENDGSADKMEDLFQDLMEIEEEMQKTVFAYIMVSTQNDEVYRVVFDTHGNDNTKKKVDRIVLSRTEISRSEDGSWQTVYAQIYFDDGSYTLGAIPAAAFYSIEENDTEATLEWGDEFGSYSETVRIKK